MQKLILGEKCVIWGLVIFSLAALVLAWQISGFSSMSSPGAFPMFSSAVMLGSILWLAIGSFKKKKNRTEGFWDEVQKAAKATIPPIFLMYTGLILLYMVLIVHLTFLPTSFGFLALSMILLKGSSPTKSVLISGAAIGIIYLVFHYLFHVVLP